MRAYIGHLGDPYAQGCVLIFASSAREAKRLFWDYAPWSRSEYEYTDIRVSRRKAWDEFAPDGPCVIETNDELEELAPGAPEFFDDIPF